MDRQIAPRADALDWIRRVTSDTIEPVHREQLINDFHFEGEAFPLIDPGPRGIRKPRGWDGALSIRTTYTAPGRARPYDDTEGPDGLQRYKARRDDRGASENQGLRVAMQQQLPVIWFVGIGAGLYTAISPVYLIAEEPAETPFVLALSEDQRLAPVDSPVEAVLRRHLIAETKRRLHQPVFANQVMRAYETRCAVCSLGHRELLDAAHVIPDGQPEGLPIVSNGLALCEIHHAAFDRNILGIRPDYVVEIHHRLLDEIDGPMLRYGLQGHHGARLRQLPQSRRDRPDPDRLRVRYAEFRSA